MFEKFALCLGKAFVVIGGTALLILLAAVIVCAACFAWIFASNAFRNICKAESMIHEYRKNREKFLHWIETESRK